MRGDRANAEQLAASNPAVSAFVGASAGSGKTKLLTDRLLRLMLSGAKPERIQCLTFTKAAAAEMSVRLQKTLGKWVTLDDIALAKELRALDVQPSEKILQDARALFAKVLDLPGGMRIGTIHAFCQSLLRRFPLEAALSPHFQLVDDREAEKALTEARETMLANANSPHMQAALETLAGLASADQFGRHVATLQADFPRLRGALDLGDGLAEAQRRVLGVTTGTEQEIRANGVNWQSERELREAALIVQRLGAKQCADRATRILEWLGLEAADRNEHWQHWCDEFLTKEGKPRAASGFVSKAVTDAHPDLAKFFHDECGRILEVLDACLALRVASVSAALLTLAAPVLRAYAKHKDASGLLDYDDLIGRTSSLLVDPGAAWVLYATGRRTGPSAAGRSAGYRAGAMEDRTCVDRGILCRCGRARRGTHGVRGGRSQAVDLFVPRCRHRRVRQFTQAAARARGSCQQAVAGGEARCVVPIDAAGARAGG